MKTLNVLLRFFIFSTTACIVCAQSQEKIYSLLIMNFAKGIQWILRGRVQGLIFS
jgi:hypothetical protein